MMSLREPAVTKQTVRFVTPAFCSLVQLCVAELRGDVDHLFASGWADLERSRILELATGLREACERQGMMPLATIARSLAALARLSPKDATPVFPILRKKFKELFLLAERLLFQQRRTG
jgi:hypothetical protein